MSVVLPCQHRIVSGFSQGSSYSENDSWSLNESHGFITTLLAHYKNISDSSLINMIVIQNKVTLKRGSARQPTNFL